MIKITIEIEERPSGMHVNVKEVAAKPRAQELMISDCYKDTLQRLAAEIGKEFPSALLIERYPEPRKER